MRTISCLQRCTLDLLYKIQVRSVLDYALPVYWHTLRVSEKDRYEQIQYKLAKLVTGALHLTSKEKVNVELGWESISVRADILGLSLFHKTLQGYQRPLISSCMPTLAPFSGHDTRSRRKFLPFPRGKVKFSKSFFVLFSRKWKDTPKEITKITDMFDFKLALKKHLAPLRYKFLGRGQKLGNKLLTRIRVGRSYLNEHSYQIQMAPSPKCACLYSRESPLHYFLDCPMYNEERRTMIGVFEQYLPKFNTYTKNKKLNIIFNGFDRDNTELFKTNVTLQYTVQNFIIKTKRFTK